MSLEKPYQVTIQYVPKYCCMHHFYWVIQYFHWPFLRQIFVNVIDDYLRNTCQMSMYTFTIKHFFSDMTKTLLRVVKVETIKSAHKKLNI